MKKITIFILGNNRINETIKSIERQVYKNIQIIASKDNEKEIDKVNNIVLLNNDELYSGEDKKDLNINLLKKIDGDYFSVLLAGDTVGIDTYRQSIDYLDSNDVDAVMLNTVYEIDGRRIVYNLLDSSIPEVLDREYANKLFNNNSKLNSVLSLYGNKIYKTKSAMNVNLNNKIANLEENLLRNIKYVKKIDCDALFHKPNNLEMENNKKNGFYSVSIDWNYGMEAIKESIVDERTSVVSFDVFDTLILRPFLEPRDEMMLMNPIINKYYKDGLGIDFYNIRFESEIYARSLVKDKEKVQDITLDEIYSAMAKMYKINTNIIDELKATEIKNELEFCMPRKISIELYKLAKFSNKKVIVISDMYLSENTIKAMVEKCGYRAIDKFYISSKIKLTKASGDLYKYVLNDLNVNAESVVHIGDNWSSDWKQSNTCGLRGQFLPRTVNLLYDSNFGKLFFKSLPFVEDNKASTNFFVIRCLLALIANKFFDNPWKNTCDDSVFNSDVKFLGYSALGMNLYGITRWILDDMNESTIKYDKIQFMARDGYLPMKSYNIMKELYPESIVAEPEYLYISRKVLIPIIFCSEQEEGIYKLIGSISVFNHSPRQVLRYIGDVVEYTENQLEDICDELEIEVDKKFETIYSFNLFLNIVRERLLRKEYVKTYMEKMQEYFSEKFKGNTCVFDIGYSARPELVLSKLCKKIIDVYYINVNEQVAFENAKQGGFKVKTFLDYKPVITGSIREILISKMGPSCIGYEVKENSVEPKFEEYNENVDYENVINTIQNMAVELIEDVVKIYGKQLNEYNYFKSFTNIPLDIFINSPGKNDTNILKVITFEDDVGIGNEISIDELLEEERKKYNQFNYNKLYNIKTEQELIGTVDIENKNKFLRAIYYALFKRDVLKRRTEEICNKLPHRRLINKLRKK